MFSFKAGKHIQQKISEEFSSHCVHFVFVLLRPSGTFEICYLHWLSYSKFPTWLFAVAVVFHGLFHWDKEENELLRIRVETNLPNDQKDGDRWRSLARHVGHKSMIHFCGQIFLTQRSMHCKVTVVWCVFSLSQQPFAELVTEGATSNEEHGIEAGQSLAGCRRLKSTQWPSLSDFVDRWISSNEKGCPVSKV